MSLISSLIGKIRNWSLHILSSSETFLRIANKIASDKSIFYYKAFKDHKVIFYANDYIGRCINKFGHYQKDTIDMAIALMTEKGVLASGGVFIDAGANIGTQTLYASLSKKFSRYISIEPDPKNYSILESNISINDLSSFTALHNCALGSVEGEMNLLRMDGNSGGARIISPDDAHDHVIPVEIHPLDKILDLSKTNPHEISFVWIDVEGYELEVLRGMPNILAHHPPIVFEHSNRNYNESELTELEDIVFSTYDEFYKLDDVPVKIDKSEFKKIEFADILALKLA